MACTAQMMGPKEQTSNWNATFPNQQATQEQSTIFMKKLLAVAVSEIMYIRAIFPEKAFGDRRVEDLELKILSEQSVVPGACQVVKWMRGCFEALEKKYLRQIQLGIYVDENNPDNAIESYVFCFVYHNDQTYLSCNNEEMASVSSRMTPDPKNDVRKATLALLRTTILLTQHLEPLPETAFLGMKLLYYDDVTPADYEPEGFKSCNTPNYCFEKHPLNVKVGTVNTKFHQLKLRVKTDKAQFEQDDPEHTSGVPAASASPVPSSTSLANSVHTDTHTNDYSANRKMECEDNETSMPESAVPDMPEERLPRTRSPGPASDASDTSFHSMGGLVRCPCDDFEDDGLMVQCMVCGYWQHGTCFAVLKNKDAPDAHYCHICADLKNPKKQPTDYFLHTLPSTSQKELCIWRRSLKTCLEVRMMTPDHLINKLNVSLDDAEFLMARLEEEGFIAPGYGRMESKKMVKKDVVKSIGIPRYLTAQKYSGSLSTASISAENESKLNRYFNSYSARDENEVVELVNDTKKLSVTPKEPVKESGKNTRFARKRKQVQSFDVSLNDSQDITRSQFPSMNSKKKIKSSASSRGIKV